MKIEIVGKPEVPCRAQFDILLAVADSLLKGQAARVTTTNSETTLKRFNWWLRRRRPFLATKVEGGTILITNQRRQSRRPAP